MKKPLFFLLGALLAAMLPTANLNAQTGYNVTWKNFDCSNLSNTQPTHDTTIHYNWADNKIRPVLTSPYQDTLLIAWYVDQALTTPWNFLEDELTSDTTLWPKWQVRTSGMVLFHIASNLEGYGDNVFAGVGDTIVALGIPGTSKTVYPMPITGFTPVQDSIVINSLPAVDTVINFNYKRNEYWVVANLKGGHFTDGTPTIKKKYYKQGFDMATDFSNNVVRDSCTFLGWSSTSLFRMPAHDVYISAMYNYHVIWTSVDTVVYDGQTNNSLYAYFIDDNFMNIPCTLNYVQGINVYSLVSNAGTYLVSASSPDPVNYPLGGTTTHALVIKPFMLTISGTQVDTVKYYDGNSVANVINPGTGNLFGNDAVTITTAARFNDAAVAMNKSIVATYLLSGANASNYLVPDTVLLTTHGAILDRIQLEDPDQDGQLLDVAAEGYCDEASVVYHLFSGSINEYQVVFSADALAAGFTNAGWQPIVNAGRIDIDIPADVPSEYYFAKLVFRNSQYPTFTSDTTPLVFHVNLPKTDVVAIFNDVVSIVDTCNCFSDFQWYHNGDTIYGATEAWYQDPNGLSGTYHVDVNMTTPDGNVIRTWTCDSAYTFTVANDAMTVTAYPNPAIDVVKLSVSNSPDYTHNLRVMNLMGQTVINTTFDGNDTDIDMHGMPHGTYTVIVDGITIRVIKR